MPPSSLAVRLLGPPEVLVDGIPLRVDTRKAIAILAYLVAMDQPQARDHLAALLWPEADDAAARGALRRTISTLRSGLGGRWLAVDRTSVRLDRGGIWADVWELRAADAGNVDPAAAAGLLRGEFLAGFGLRDAPDFDDWMVAQADAWRQRAIAVLDRLVEHQGERGDLPGAIATASRRLELDRLDEAGHRRLMELHARAGDRSAALRQYRVCVRMLADELGVDPLPVTSAAYEAILSGKRLPPAARRPHEAARPVSMPLVGREAELSALRQGWESEIAPLLLISGEPGIGKTRLAGELTTLVAAGGGRWVELRGHAGNRETPYAPVVELLERVATEDPARIATLDPRLRDEVARLVPRLAAAHAHVAPLEGPGARARFTDALATTLAVVAGDLLLVDDVHLLDAASTSLLGQVARRRQDRRPLLAICRRPVDPAEDPLLPVIAEARRQGWLVEIAPRRLTAHEVQRIVREVGANADPGGLFAESGGVPFYLAERLAAIRAGADPAEIPAGIRDLVRLRVTACGDIAQQVLAAGAVLGAAFDIDLARDVSGRSVDEAAGAVDELVARGIVVRREDRLEIDHELTRDVILHDLGLGRRRILHRRSASAIVRRGGRRRSPADVATHLQAAGDDAGAAKWFRIAGERAVAVHAHAEAVAHFRASLALAPVPDPHLHLLIAERQMLLGRYRDAVASFEAAAGGLSPPELARADIGLARAHRRLGSLALAAAHLETAAAALPEDWTTERAAIHLEHARIADREGRATDARHHADEALRLAKEGGEAMELAQAHNLCGLLARHRQDSASAHAHLEEALRLAATLPGPDARMAALNNIALLEAGYGSTASAEARLRQALRLAVSTADRHHEAALRSNLGDILNADGRRDEALAEVARSAAILAELGGIGSESVEPTPEVWRLVDW